MSNVTRRKGLRAEAEVRAIYEAFGYTVRGLEGGGDHLALGHGVTIHSEVKRQEVLRLPLWCRQARDEAAAEAIPVVAYRQNRGEWQALAPEVVVAPYLRAAGMTSGIHFTLRQLAGEWWAHLPLVSLIPTLSRCS